MLYIDVGSSTVKIYKKNQQNVLSLEETKSFHFKKDFDSKVWLNQDEKNNLINYLENIKQKYKNEKIKKSNSDLVIELVRNPDILLEMSKKKEKQLLVGFAAETNNIKENSLKKLEKKNLDIIVANNASVMGSDENVIEIIKKDRTSVKISQKSKMELTYDILNEVIFELKKDKVFWNYGCVDFYKFIDFVKGRINYEIWKTKDKKSVHVVS